MTRRVKGCLKRIVEEVLMVMVDAGNRLPGIIDAVLDEWMV